jgi:hypothetical protein
MMLPPAIAFKPGSGITKHYLAKALPTVENNIKKISF